LAFALGAWACEAGGPEAGAGLALRFAQVDQALGGEPGLPAEVESLRLNAFRGGLQVGTSGCLDLDQAGRLGFELDLAPGPALWVEALGFEAPACAGPTAWSGRSREIEVLEGERVALPVYVLRRGYRLNPARGSLPGGRAFASATALQDGRVLLAGGFDRIVLEGPGRARLLAACDALLYDPGRAEVVRAVPMLACRGLHRAVRLSDGTVWLLGGAAAAGFDLAGELRPVLRADPGGLVGQVERFDPEAEAFESVTWLASLARADAAAVVQDFDRMVMLGGRTQSLRSADVVTGGRDGQWFLFADRLRAPRAGARAINLALGASRASLVVGGSPAGEAPAELVAFGSMTSEPVSFTGPAPELDLVGHGLAPFGDGGFGVVGGMRLTPGARPRPALVLAAPSAGGFHAQERLLSVPRAHHAVAWLADLDGERSLVVAGGLNYSLSGAPELERCDQAGVCQLLPDQLTAGPVGLASAELLDGSLLLAGGLRADLDGTLGLSATLELLAP
jgi:hypothetical protein